MHHLQHAVIETDGTRDVARLADREELFEIVCARTEIGDNQIAGFVARIDQVRHAIAAGRCGAVAVHRHLHRHHGAGLNVAQLWPGSAVDGPDRHVEQQIDKARHVIAAEQPAIELLHLRSDARKRRDRSEKRVKQGGPHIPTDNAE